MRILGIDPGERRVGLAVSDELGFTAQGLKTFDRRDGLSFMDHLTELVGSMEIGEIVVGLPLMLSGRAGGASKKAERFARLIERRIGIRVTLWDERFTSRQAERVLKGSRASKGAVDKISAVIILQNYLDFINGDGSRSNDGGRK